MKPGKNMKDWDHKGFLERIRKQEEISPTASQKDLFSGAVKACRECYELSKKATKMDKILGSSPLNLSRERTGAYLLLIQDEVEEIPDHFEICGKCLLDGYSPRVAKNYEKGENEDE
jgi:hypothetical protein